MSPNQFNIVADAHIWGVHSAFSHLPGYECRLNVLESCDITPAVVQKADVLLTRSTTKVDAKLLRESAVRFVGTATIGDDHVDKQYLRDRGIAFASAAGSSTGSVLEYMIAALFELHARGLIAFLGDRIAIIGAGRIGSRVGRICSAIGMQIMLNDPPRQRTEDDGAFHPLNEVLEEADILTLHTPLIREGEDCTVHLLGAAELGRFRGRGIINAARGECIDNHALVDWLDGDNKRWAVLDCWEGEPHISRRLLSHSQVIIATPHIAGHSLDGKAANTQFVYNALCQFLGIHPAWSMSGDLPAVSYDGIHSAESGDDLQRLERVSEQLYSVMRDSEALKALSNSDNAELAAGFVRLRRHYHVRRGWVNYEPVQLFGKTVPHLVKNIWQTMEPEYE